MEQILELDTTEPGFLMFYGQNDNGKSTITSKILDGVPRQRVAIIDYHNEYTKLADHPNIDRFIPTAKERNSKQELMDFIRWALGTIKAIGYDVIVIDEFNQYVENSKHETPYELNDLKNNVAHDEWHGAFVVLIMRSPSQGDSDFRENARYVMTAGQQGKNARDFLNDRVDGFGDVSQALMGSYHFAVHMPSGQIKVCEPVDEKYATAKR